MKKFVFWVLAFILTAATLYYQRKTGPTYPHTGKVTLNDSVIAFKLARAHGGEEDHEIKVETENSDIGGYITYKRYKTADDWTTVPMSRINEVLVAKLPHQPPAGKLMYKVILTYNEKEVSLSGEQPVIIRFRGDVPAVILLLHIIIIFSAMFVSNRTGLEALNPKGKHIKYAIWVIGFLFVGGVIFGPLMQKFAFGVWWSGFPIGKDLTDTKTLVALVGWIIALVIARNRKSARWWYLGAAILLLVVYLIPHSLLGSELDYSKMAPSIR